MLPPLALGIFVYDLTRLKAFLKKVDLKEAEEAGKMGRQPEERSQVLYALGVQDEFAPGQSIPLKKRVQRWFLR